MMTPRTSIVGQMAAWNPFSRFWKRALFFLAPTAVLLVLAAFPERYRAEATLTPTNPNMLGLSGTLGQLGALNSVFGNQADIEVALRIGTSVYTRDSVIKELKLKERLKDDNIIDLHRWLYDKVDMRSLRGGIILIQMDHTDKQLARDIVGAYTTAVRERLAEITVRQTNYKRQVLEKLVRDAGARLANAQSNYDNFRLANGYADPERTVEIIGDRVPQLQAALQAQDRSIAAASRLYTDDNLVIIQLRTQREAIAAQLREALDNRPGPQGGTVGEAVNVSSKLFEYERELELAQTLYANYLRYLEGTTVEDLTSTANIRLLEQPYVDTERQYRWPLVAAAFALFLLWMAVEFYRLRPPVGSRLAGEEREVRA